MTLSQLDKYTDIDAWSDNNPSGYQRPVVASRLKQIAKYVLEEQGVLPTSILLGTRPDDETPIQLEGFNNDNSPVDFGSLIIPEGATLWVIDGQHRYFGVHFAHEGGSNPELADYAFPITVMWGISQYREMEHFNIINTTQKKMPTDIADRHLIQLQAAGALDQYKSGARGERDYVRATATKMIDELRDQPGVWKNNISIQGVPGRDSGLVRQHAMVVSIEPFIRDPWVKGRSEADMVKILSNYWEAIAGVWPDAIASPKDHRLQATAGIYSLHMALPVFIQRCLERGNGDLTANTMREVLLEADLQPDFWHKQDGDPMTLGTGMGSIRALSRYIVDQIPVDVDSGGRF